MKTAYKKWVGIGGLKCYCCRVDTKIESQRKTQRGVRRKDKVLLRLIASLRKTY